MMSRWVRILVLVVLVSGALAAGLLHASGAEFRARASAVVAPAQTFPDKTPAFDMQFAPGDEPPPEVLVPRGARSIATTTNPGAVETFDAMDAAGGNWYMYDTNDRGAYAWGESYVMNAYLTMYEVTGKLRYLDKFVTHADAIVARTDQARRVRDYRGKSLPAWRTGGYYTLGTLNLLNKRGRPAIKIIAVRADGTRVAVTPGSDAGKFTLWIRNSTIGVREVFRNLSVDPHSAAYFARRINGTSRIITTRPFIARPRVSRDTPRPLASTRMRPKFYLFAVHTGLMATPLARFARIVRSDPSLDASYGEAATRFVDAAGKAVAVHNDEWVDAGWYGYYKFRYGAPVWCDGVELPHNQYSTMGTAFLELYAATGVDAYKVRASKLAANLKRDLRLDRTGGYVWRYWWGTGASGWRSRSSPSYYTPSTGPRRRTEDISHAGLSIDFANAAAALGTTFTQADRIRFANTFHAGMTRTDGTLARYVDGTGPAVTGSSRLSGTGYWLGLAPVSRDVFLTVNRHLADVLASSPRGFGGLLYAVANDIQARRTLKLESRPMLAPVITLASPAPGPRVAGRLTIAVNVAGEAAPFVAFFGDGFGSGIDASSPYQWQWRTRAVRDGVRTFGAVASDPEGRTSAVRLRLVVDNTGPVVSARPKAPIISPNGDGYAEGTAFAIRSSEDATAQLRLLDLARRRRITPADSVVRLKNGTRYWRWNGRYLSGAPLPNGRYYLTAAASDTVGNAGTVAKAAIVINNTLYRVGGTSLARRGRLVRTAFTLRYGAAVWLKVLDAKTRAVSHVGPRLFSRLGRHGLVWNGRNGDGETVGRGVYRIVTYARNKHGTVAVSRWVRITR